MGELKLITIGAGVVINNGSVLMIKRQTPPYTGYWAIPGGKIEPGEHVEEAILREIKEETGIDCEVESLNGIASEIIHERKTGEKKAHFLIFVAKLKPKSIKLTRQEGEGEVQWISVDELEREKVVPSDMLMFKEFITGGKKTAVSRIKMIDDGDVYEVEEFR